MAGVTAVELSCAELSVRELNAALRGLPDGSAVRITEPRGRHNLAVGLTNPSASPSPATPGTTSRACATARMSRSRASSAGRSART